MLYRCCAKSSPVSIWLVVGTTPDGVGAAPSGGGVEVSRLTSAPLLLCVAAAPGRFLARLIFVTTSSGCSSGTSCLTCGATGVSGAGEAATLAAVVRFFLARGSPLGPKSARVHMATMINGPWNAGGPKVHSGVRPFKRSGDPGRYSGRRRAGGLLVHMLRRYKMSMWSIDQTCSSVHGPHEVLWSTVVKRSKMRMWSGGPEWSRGPRSTRGRWSTVVKRCKVCLWSGGSPTSSGPR